MNKNVRKKTTQERQFFNKYCISYNKHLKNERNSLNELLDTDPSSEEKNRKKVKEKDELEKVAGKRKLKL